MATVTMLSGPDGPLTLVRVKLRAGVLPVRSFYALPEFVETMQKDLPSWVTGRMKAAQTPVEQFGAMLSKWNSGKEMKYDKHVKDLMPGTDEVWEMKTPDLRMFGWIYRPGVFIALRLGYADWYKHPNPKESYEKARADVIAARDTIDLDFPKFATGDYDALVGI